MGKLQLGGVVMVDRGARSMMVIAAKALLALTLLVGISAEGMAADPVVAEPGLTTPDAPQPDSAVPDTGQRPRGSRAVVHPERIAVPSMDHGRGSPDRPPASPGAPQSDLASGKVKSGAGSPPLQSLALLSGQPAAAPAPPCPASSTQQTQIFAQAMALKCDPDLIFEYVYNNIEFEPIYGSHKGPLGTLLDRRGSDADPAILLNALLDAAGYPAGTTGFANSSIRLTGAQLSNWLNVINEASAIGDLLNGGGIPYTMTTNQDGSVNYIDIIHFVSYRWLWVWSGSSWQWTTAYFDPSYKQHNFVGGLSHHPSVLSDRLLTTRIVA